VNEIIRDRLANNFPGGANYTGDVYVLNKTGGCDGAVPVAIINPNCVKFTVPLASWSAGIPAAGTQTNVATWTNTSTQTFKSFIGNGTSLAVTPLTLPFVQGANGSAQQIQIIRKTIDPAELATSPVGASREYNKANIRVLLANTQLDLHPERGLIGDGQDMDLQNRGGALCPPAGGSPVNVGAGTTTFAMARTATDARWVQPTGLACNPWSLVDGWLRVEYRNTAGNWIASPPSGSLGDSRVTSCRRRRRPQTECTRTRS